MCFFQILHIAFLFRFSQIIFINKHNKSIEYYFDKSRVVKIMPVIVGSHAVYVFYSWIKLLWWH